MLGRLIVQQIQMDYTSAVEMQMKLMIIFISCYYFTIPQLLYYISFFSPATYSYHSAGQLNFNNSLIIMSKSNEWTILLYKLCTLHCLTFSDINFDSVKHTAITHYLAIN